MSWASKQGQALLHPARDTAVLATPEQTMVDKDRIGPGRNGGLNQGPTGGHARDHLSHRRRALDLQAIGAIVLESARAAARRPDTQKRFTRDVRSGQGLGHRGSFGRSKRIVKSVGELLQVPPGRRRTACHCTLLSQPLPRRNPSPRQRAAPWRPSGAAPCNQAGQTLIARLLAARSRRHSGTADAVSCHRTATQARGGCLDNNTPSGHGSSRQHTPQPLQGAPSAASVAHRVNVNGQAVIELMEPLYTPR